MNNTEVVVKQPWRIYILLMLVGAAAGAVANQAMQSPVKERIVSAPYVNPEPVKVTCLHKVEWPEPLKININGLTYTIQKK